jgi:hypothetical protein
MTSITHGKACSKAIDASLASDAGTELKDVPAKPDWRPYEILESRPATAGIVDAWLKVGFSDDRVFLFISGLILAEEQS